MTEKLEASVEEKALGTAVAAYLIAQAAATKHSPEDQKEMAEIIRKAIAGFGAGGLNLSPAAAQSAQYRLTETAEMLEHNAAM